MSDRLTMYSWGARPTSRFCPVEVNEMTVPSPEMAGLALYAAAGDIFFDPDPRVHSHAARDGDSGSGTSVVYTTWLPLSEMDTESQATSAATRTVEPLLRSLTNTSAVPTV